MKKKLLFSLLFFFMLANVFGQLSGTYTIDPGQVASASNYTTINAAVEDLTNGIRPDGGPVNGFGVTGPVIFNIADGDYNESVYLKPIFNSSTTNTITFQSASGDSTSVRIYYTPDNLSNYSVVSFNNADFYVLKHLTIEAIAGTSTTYAVRVDNNSQNNTISNCVLQGIQTSSTSTSYSTFYHYGSGCNDNQYLNNLVLDGSTGFYLYYGNRNIIKGNQFKGQHSYGIYMRYNTDSKIMSNTFTNPDNYDYYAMYLYYNYDSTHIIGNIIDGDYYMGIYMRYTYGTVSKPVVVANNMIHLGELSNGKYGIYCYYSNYVHFYYNSINLTNNNSNARAFYLYQGTSNSIRLQNNNFASKYGPAMYINTTGPIEISDYNNYYSENYNLGYWSGWRSNLANWQSSSGQDANSISVSPKFFSKADLHTFDRQLDTLGIPNSEILTDIDGELRDTLTPDIGADEFSRLQLDAELVSVDSLGSSICPGSQNIYITVLNYGTTPLTSLDILAQLDGKNPTSYSWTGTLAPNSSESINIGALDFDPFAEQTLKVYCQHPNASVDSNASNDTIVLELNTALPGGTYTIGGTEPDFENFGDAIEAISNNGVCGNVVFNVRDGVYEENLLLNEIPGTDESNTITFRSESSDNSVVTLLSNNFDYTIRFDGADYVSFEELTIEQPNSGNVVEFNNNSDNNQFINCVLKGYETESTSSSYAVIYVSNSYLNSSNIFENNLFLDGSYGIYYLGQNTGSLSKEVTINNNIFMDQYYMGIYLQYLDAPVVTNNHISTNTLYSSYSGIYMSYCDNEFEISGNKIYRAYRGIRLEYSDATGGNESIISNNFIQTGKDGVSYGIDIYSSSYLNVYYNSVNETGMSTDSRAFSFSTGNNLRILNNIFASKYGYAYYIGTSSAIDTSEHNNYYSTGDNLAYWNGIHNDLASLRSASSMDVNSSSVFPNFVSDTNLLVDNIVLNNNGLAVPEVTTDITGVARNATTPDIGAIEFDATGTLDAAIVYLGSDDILPKCAGYYNLYGVLVNNSPDTLFTCNIEWELNGVAQTAAVFNDTLVSGGKTSLLVDSILFVEGMDYKVKVWSDLPNGSADDYPENDTAETTLYAALNGTYTLGGTSPDFADFTELANHLNYGGLCGPSTVNVRDGSYNEQILIGYISGSSAANHLTIQSESGVSDNTILEWASKDYLHNYTLGLYNTDHISFKDITFKALGNDYGTVVSFEDNDSLFFTGNTFSSNIEATEDNEYLNLLNSINNNGKDKHFIGNHFVGGDRAIYLDGTGIISGTVISQNEISNSFSGIYINDDFSPEISENTVHAKISGIYINDVDDNFIISKNKVLVTGINNNYNVYGIQMYNCSADTGIISNNFISNTNTYDVSTYGVYLSNSYDVQVLYNNVRNSNPYDYNSALYIYSGNGYVIKNNILANTGSGYAAYCNGAYSSTIDTSDYNDYFSEGNYIFYANGYKIPSLDMLRFVSGNDELDSNSVVVDPLFNSATDLHVNEISLNALGVPVNSITDDIDGDLRNIATPDIGADEFDVMNVDAAVAVINTKEDFLCDNAYTVYAKIRNLGTNTLTSGSVNWSVNGVTQTAYSWSGSLTAGQTTDSITLGTYNYTQSSNDPFKLLAWTSSPNGATDEKPDNDTASSMLYPGMSGSFTIGHNGTEDFASIGEAVDRLMNSGGLCGPVTFNISDGTYEEYIQLDELTSSSDTNTVTFQSASGDASLVTITYSGGDYFDAVIAINGCDYLIFNNITVEQTSSSDYCIQFENGATNNSITNCVLKNSNNGYAIYSDNWYDIEDNNNSFTNNEFWGGRYGIYWYGWNDGYNIETGMVVENNRFLNQDRYAIYVEYCDSVILKDNYIINTTEATGYDYAIYLYQEYSSGYFKVANNEIIMNEGQEGIYIEYARGYSDRPSIIANNSISINTTQSYVYGIYIYESANFDVLHNSVNIVNASNNSYAFYVEYGANINILNNIFVNQSGGYAYYYDWPPYSITKSDYNTVYSSGLSPFYHYNFGNIKDLATWNTYTGFDAHSLELMPVFAADDDLHLCDSKLDNKGIYLESIQTDLDGDNRNTLTPDMGADEFTAISNFDLGGTISLCNEPVTLDAGPVNGTYLWSTGDTTRTISVASTGTYSVSVTTTCGSTSDEVDVIESTDIPVASFTSEMSYLTAAFTNTSSNSTSYIWNFDDGNTSAEMSPTHLYSSEGTYTVSLKAVNSCSADSTESTIEIHIVDLEESEFAENVQIYPNPNNGLFSIGFDFSSNKDAELQIYNIAGNLMYNDSYKNITAANKTIDMSDYPTGNYTIILRIDNQLITHKLIIE